MAEGAMVDEVVMGAIAAPEGKPGDVRDRSRALWATVLGSGEGLLPAHNELGAPYCRIIWLSPSAESSPFKWWQDEGPEFAGAGSFCSRGDNARFVDEERREQLIALLSEALRYGR